MNKGDMIAFVDMMTTRGWINGHTGGGYKAALSKILVDLLGHSPGQQLVDAVDWMLRDALEHEPQVGVRVDVVELGAADEGVDHRRARAAGIGAQMQVILATDCDTSQRALGEIVVRLHATVINKANQGAPIAQRITDGTGHIRLGRKLAQGIVEPTMHFIQYWSSSKLSLSPSLIGRPPLDVGLDFEDGCYALQGLTRQRARQLVIALVDFEELSARVAPA